MAQQAEAALGLLAEAMDLPIAAVGLKTVSVHPQDGRWECGLRVSHCAAQALRVPLEVPLGSDSFPVSRLADLVTNVKVMVDQSTASRMASQKTRGDRGQR